MNEAENDPQKTESNKETLTQSAQTESLSDFLSRHQDEVESDPLHFVSDVSLRLEAELARMEVPLHELLAWKTQHVVKFRRIVGEPVDLVIRDRLIARGEVVIVEDHFAIRVVEICNVDEKIQSD